MENLASAQEYIEGNLDVYVAGQDVQGYETLDGSQIENSKWGPNFVRENYQIANHYFIFIQVELQACRPPAKPSKIFSWMWSANVFT